MAGCGDNFAAIASRLSLRGYRFAFCGKTSEVKAVNMHQEPATIFVAGSCSAMCSVQRLHMARNALLTHS